MPSKKAVGAALSAILRERGMKQKDLAAITGLDPSRISRVVRGEVMPTVTTLERMLRPLEITAGQFLEYAERFDAFQRDQGITSWLAPTESGSSDTG
ncbi:MAG: helix-turn-helix transcriptional regulator [Acidobacteriota bacterium]